MLVDDLDDGPYIERAKAGETQAFDVIVRRYALPVYRIALRMTNNSEDAEDIQQETFIRAYKYLPRYRGESSFSTWLHSIAVNLCLSRHHTQTRRPVTVPLDDRDADDERGGVEWQFDCSEEADHVQSVLATFAPSDRLVLILKYIEGFSHEEIARMLHCSPGSCRSRLHRTSKLFRERFVKGQTDEASFTR